MMSWMHQMMFQQQQVVETTPWQSHKLLKTYIIFLACVFFLSVCCYCLTFASLCIIACFFMIVFCCCFLYFGIFFWACCCLSCCSVVHVVFQIKSIVFCWFFCNLFFFLLGGLFSFVFVYCYTSFHLLLVYVGLYFIAAIFHIPLWFVLFIEWEELHFKLWLFCHSLSFHHPAVYFICLLVLFCLFHVCV